MSVSRFHKDLEFKEVAKQSIGGLTYFVRDIDLPVWNMDSTASITFTFGTTLGVMDITNEGVKRIMGAWCRIIDDSGVYHISQKDLRFSWNTTTLTITRVTGGLFDSTDFDATASSRGIVYLKLST